jgi:putative mRNA 3-end processing factor
VNLLELGPNGIECPQAGVHIDPWGKVERALLTHAHADHARFGHKHYIAHSHNQSVLRERLGKNISLQDVKYEQAIEINGVRFSWHPAGHIPGSAQIRVEGNKQTWVVSGDYKTENDQLSPAFEPIPCSHFITECTFGLPIYRWKPQTITAQAIIDWHNSNIKQGYSTLLYAYALGKAQRLLHLLRGIEPIYIHPSVSEMNKALQSVGYPIPHLPLISEWKPKLHAPALFIAPPGASSEALLRRLSPCKEANVSGWTQIRGTRRRQNLNNGFALSDHADWPGLLSAIEGTGAEHIYCTHGFTSEFSRHLNQQGYHSTEIETRFLGEHAPDHSPEPVKDEGIH